MKKYLKFILQIATLLLLVFAAMSVGFYVTLFFADWIDDLFLFLGSILFFGSLFLIVFRILVSPKIYRWITFPLDYPWLIKGLPND